jgi:oxygen-independent coproporphyrinogen-3 oxidase
MQTLQKHLGLWIKTLELPSHVLESVFIGGGTPSLYGDAWNILLDSIQPWLKTDCEITLESNPDDITDDNLALWKNAGINRLSIGVQSFDDLGLKALSRNHNGASALSAVKRAVNIIENVNVDLIYGWPGQTLASWRQDLQTAAPIAKHLSLYNLTFEPRTTLGRKVSRGVVQPTDDDSLVSYYEVAMEELDQAGFDHEEVSNWSKPGYSCRHNWLYWDGEYYLGVGTGAHGYLPSEPFGRRFAYDRSDRKFLRGMDSRSLNLLETNELISFETGRSKSDLLTEYVAGRLRTHRGVDLTRCEALIERPFSPSPILKEGLEQGSVSIGEGHLTLSKPEWFREAGWAVEILQSFEI